MDKDTHDVAGETVMICKHQYVWSRYCGAKVCDGCDDHEGLARCYCGWPAGEKLEDDIGDATWNGNEWEVDY